MEYSCAKGLGATVAHGGYTQLNIETTRQSLVYHFVFIYIASFFALGVYKLILDKNTFRKHLSAIRLVLGFVFLGFYLYGVQIVLKASNDMESVVNMSVKDGPGAQERLRARCRLAWTKDVVGAEKNNLADLSPCVTLIAAISKEQKDINDGKATLPTNVFTLLIAFLSAFQGGMFATFMYAWVTTVRAPFDTRD